MRLVQLIGPDGRSVAAVHGPALFPLTEHSTVYELAMAARVPLREYAASLRGTKSLDYDDVYEGRSEWKLLPPIDHPSEAARCLVTGTGLTHMKSASNRQAMHGAEHEVTDSMRMYRWGVEGGRPAPGSPGISPEWFYKGTGQCLRAHNDPLEVPEFAEDGGEEPEIAGVYIIDDDGAPRRIGMTTGNEFSDHQFEKLNYLYLASSKLRTCAIGPELVLNPDFRSVPGEVAVERGSRTLWSRSIRTGEEAMCHSLANIEHHHFKFPGHRRPGDVHVHFFGADAFSFGEGVHLEHGDVMTVRFEGFGRALRNLIHIAPRSRRLWSAEPL